jgi:hypothetical protein
MSYHGENDGGVSFLAWGGAGDDLVRASMVADPGSVAPAPGGFRANLEGEAGDDQLTLYISAPREVAVQGYIDGGEGTDQGITNSPVIEIKNCTP